MSARAREEVLSKLTGRRGTALLLLVLAFASPAAPSRAVQKADSVVVKKGERRLLLMRGNQVLKTYRVALGGQPQGPKRCQGDERTPEGVYVLDSRNHNSRFYRSLHVSYPNAADRQAARAQGCDPGGDIMVHGLPGRYAWLGRTHALHDWTRGCIAVANDEIEEIWDSVPNGTRIEIRP